MLAGVVVFDVSVSIVFVLWSIARTVPRKILTRRSRCRFGNGTQQSDVLPHASGEVDVVVPLRYVGTDGQKDGRHATAACGWRVCFPLVKNKALSCFLLCFPPPPFLSLCVFPIGPNREATVSYQGDGQGQVRRGVFVVEDLLFVFGSVNFFFLLVRTAV